jgi:hypothetical protein
VLLVAGSDQQAVFDNARRALAEALRRKIPFPVRIAQLSARRDLPPGEGVAPGASACLLVTTSHGTPRGLVLTYKDELLTPAFLDRLLMWVSPRWFHFSALRASASTGVDHAVVEGARAGS